MSRMPTGTWNMCILFTAVVWQEVSRRAKEIGRVVCASPYLRYVCIHTCVCTRVAEKTSPLYARSWNPLSIEFRNVTSWHSLKQPRLLKNLWKQFCQNDYFFRVCSISVFQGETVKVKRKISLRLQVAEFQSILFQGPSREVSQPATQPLDSRITSQQLDYQSKSLRANSLAVNQMLVVKCDGEQD